MNKNKLKILAISGSTRKKSSNESILKAIEQLFSDKLEVDIYRGIDQLPHFNPDLDNDNPPIVIRDLRDRIRRSDGVVICSPEYVFSLPGSLKNAIDWNVSTTVFSNKPVAFIIAAASGEKAYESLDLIMTTIEARITPNSKLLIQGGRGKIGKDGEIYDSETSESIKVLVESLMDCINEVNPTPTKYQS